MYILNNLCQKFNFGMLRTAGFIVVLISTLSISNALADRQAVLVTLSNPATGACELGSTSSNTGNGLIKEMEFRVQTGDPVDNILDAKTVHNLTTCYQDVIIPLGLFNHGTSKIRYTVDGNNCSWSGNMTVAHSYRKGVHVLRHEGSTPLGLNRVRLRALATSNGFAYYYYLQFDWYQQGATPLVNTIATTVTATQGIRESYGEASALASSIVAEGEVYNSYDAASTGYLHKFNHDLFVHNSKVLTESSALSALSNKFLSIQSGGNVSFEGSGFSLNAPNQTPNSTAGSSFSLGYQNSSTQSSFTSGYNNRASYSSFASGTHHRVHNASLASGSSNTAYNLSVAFGLFNNVNGDSVGQYPRLSMASGGSNYILGSHSFASGSNNRVTSHGSAAIGRYLINASDSGVVVGQYNQDQANVQFSVGNGTDAQNRSNAFVVLKDGSVIISKAQGDISMGIYQ